MPSTPGKKYMPGHAFDEKYMLGQNYYMPQACWAINLLNPMSTQ